MAVAEQHTFRGKIAAPFADPVGDPLRPVVARRFPLRTLLTPPDLGQPLESVLYAVGRDDIGRVVVEVEQDGEVIATSLLMGFVNHAPDLFATIDSNVLRSLPN